MAANNAEISFIMLPKSPYGTAMPPVTKPVKSFLHPVLTETSHYSA